MEQRLIVVGASLAGLRAVEAARRDGYTGAITLVGAEPHLPYDRPPLSKEFLEADQLPEPHTFRTEDSLRDELDVDLRLGVKATGLDTEARTLATTAGPLAYTQLVIATGGTPRLLPGMEVITTDGSQPARNMAGVHVLRTIDDARAIRTAMEAGARTVVVGAGFIGSEVASSARKRGLSATIVEALPVPLDRAVGHGMGAALARLHERNGTDLRCGVTVDAVEGDGRVQAVRLSDGSRIEADLVVVGIGVVPATGWLEDSGLELRDGIVCDEMLATGAPGVYAAGDIVRWPNAVFGEQMRLEHWTMAAEMGRTAARNALNPEAAKPYTTVPYFWSDWYDSRIQFVGSPAADEIQVVVDDLDAPHFLALYRRGDRLIGALALNYMQLIMKFRVLISRRATWEEGLEFARHKVEHWTEATKEGLVPAAH